ncbi:MAG: hypothetical protein IT456_12080 [Planctomycetes bacterium]|nr:hypothetical protein [Planctomycetota bacterium]
MSLAANRGSALWLCALVAACAGSPPTPTPPPVQPNREEPVANNTGAPPTNTPTVPAPETGLTQFANGMTVAFSSVAPTGEAQLQLGLFGGSDFAAPGVAELAAEALVGGNDASSGRPDLRKAIANLGGTVKVEVGPLTSWITVRVPARRWQEAQTALAAAVSQPTQSRNQLERIRDDLVARRVGAIWSSPDRESARIFLLGAVGTDDYMSSLLDRDVSEITLFQTRLYRPDSALLSLRVPGNAPNAYAVLAKGLGAWQVTGGRQLVPITERRLKSGIYWSPSAVPLCRITILLPLPDMFRADSADLFVMHSCLTLDGIGGRLEQLQRERGLAHIRWRSQFLQFAEVSAIALSTEALPSEAIKLWQCVEGARRSLAELAPTQSEYELAHRRAMLTARLGENDTATQLRNQATYVMRRASPQALQQRFLAIRELRAFDPAGAAKRYLEMPAAMVVFGGEVPADAPTVSKFDLLPQGAYARLTGADTKTQTIAAQPWLEEAIEAIGGHALLKRVVGFDSEASLRANQSPAATEILRWDTAGELQRTRELLGTRIETSARKDKGTEQAGGKTVELKPGEVAALHREMRRHPIALLAAHARGELQVRPIAQRNVGDRDLMILEAVGEPFDRLRIHVDTISHLIRVVEAWETTTDGAIVHLQEAWSDYRTAKGLRAPFRRLTTQDDGQNRIETIYTSWAPRFRAQ